VSSDTQATAPEAAGDRATGERWPGEPLPRGRHKLGRARVRASQRARLLSAMLACVGERGYAATTVPEVVAAARVSRNAFYDLFEDKTDCFMAVCDELTAELLDAMYGLADEPDWISALRRGMTIYLRWWRDRPEVARAYLVELPAAGARAIEQRDRHLASFRDLFAALGARARVEDPRLPPLPRLAPRLLVLGLNELVAEEVRAGRTAQLGRLHPDLLHHTVTLLADEATAQRL
jgi:AcrR family transcriptional regulator